MSRLSNEQSTAEIDVFSGIMTSLEPSSIPDGYAQDALNVRFDGGRMCARYGFGALADPPAGFVSVHGFGKVSGYDSNGNAVNDVIAMFRLSSHSPGYCKAYRLNRATWQWVELTKPAGAACVLSATDWLIVSIRDKAYFINPNDSVYSYVIGDADSLVKLDSPDTPTGQWSWTTQTSSMRYNFEATDASSSSEMVVTGAVKQSTSTTDVSTRSFNIQHNRSGTTTGSSSIKIVCDGGTGRPAKVDMMYNDFLWFAVKPVSKATVFDIDKQQFTVELTNDDGLTFTADKVNVFNNSVNGYSEFWVRAEFKSKTRSQWGNGSGTGKINSVKLGYYILKNTAGSDYATTVNISMPILGWVNPFPDGWEENISDELTFGYTAYDSASGWESDMAGVKGVSYAMLTKPYNAYYYAPPKITITIPYSFSDADKWRLYLKDEDGVFRLVNEQDDTSRSYVINKSYAEMLAGNIYEPTKFDTDSPMSCAGRFRGSMVWGYAKGEDNIAFSRTTNAQAQSTIWDAEDDLDKGENYSLSDTYDDIPYGIIGFGDYLFTLGAKRIYWQIGDRPSNMSAPAPVPASYGVAGRHAFCPWTDDDGSPVLTYMDVNGNIWSVSMTSAGPRSVEISRHIRGYIMDWLSNGQSLPLSGVSAFVDRRTNSLWFLLGHRAVSLYAPHEVTGMRTWMAHDFTLDGVYRVCYDPDEVLWLRTTGVTDEVFWNSSTSSFRTGSLKDGGQSAPYAYWKSGEYVGANGRIDHLHVDATNCDEFQVLVDSSRLSELYTWPNSERYCRTSPWQQGWSHSFTIFVPEDGTINGFSFKIRGAGRRLNA